jgi:hypothetical protein
MTYDVVSWLEGTRQLDPSNAGDQSALRKLFKEELPDMDKESLEWVARKLIQKGSAFVAALLHRYPDLTLKQKVAALNSLSRRRNMHVAEFRNAPVKLEYEVLVKLSHKRRLKILKIFLANENEVAMTKEQFDNILFHYLNTDSQWVNTLKENAKKKERLKEWPKEKTQKLYLNYKVQEIVDDVKNGRLQKISDMLWKHGIEYMGGDDLLTHCLKLGLIK